MSKRVLSQAAPMPANGMAGMASNPANGMQNIPLSSGAGNGVAGADGVLSPEELLKALDTVSRCSPADMQKHKCNIESLLQRSQNEDVKLKLMNIIGAMQTNSDPTKLSKDPITGKPDPTAAQLAQELAQEIREMTKNSSANDSGAQTKQASFNLRRMIEAQAKSKGGNAEGGGKKKTRGNPFRVLMGKVGKLLDHGLEKRDIVRYVLKDKIWNEETIGKAVDIVRDYNRKKHKSGEDDKHKSEKKDEKKDEKSEKKASNNAFNLRRFAEKTGNEVYDAKPDFTKRSTAELMARASWLESLQSYNENTPQGDGRKAADKSGAAAELKSIRAALKARGLDESEIS